MIENMVTLLKRRHDLVVDPDAIMELECEILKKLNFDIRYIPSVTFLERFQRIFFLDQETTDLQA